MTKKLEEEFNLLIQEALANEKEEKAVSKTSKAGN